MWKGHWICDHTNLAEAEFPGTTDFLCLSSVVRISEIMNMKILLS